MKKSITYFILITGLICINLFSGIHSQTIFSTEDFESAGPDIPASWTESGASTDGIWSVGSSTDASSSYWSVPNHTVIAYTNDDACNCDKSQDRLILPIQDFSSQSGSPVLSFDAHNNGSYGGSGLIEVSLDGGTTWATAYTIPTSADWQDGLQYNLDYAGESSVTIALTYNDGGGWAGGLAVDNISISEAPSCPNLDIATFSSANITSSSAVISWTAGADETVWNVEYGEAGFTQGAGSTQVVSASSYSLTGLTANTSYDVYVQADCGSGLTGAWAGPFNFTTDCNAVADINENFDADASLPNCFSITVDGAYASAEVLDATAGGNNGSNFVRLRKFQDTEAAILILPPVTTLGDNYRLKFSVNNYTATTGSVLNVGTIDGDGNFTSFQEITITSNSAWENQTIDFSSYTGTATKIAITAGYNATSNSNNQYSDTHIDDVVWEQIPSCTEPSGLTASSITTVSANLSWTAGADETNWNVEYGETGFTQGAGSTQAVSASSYSLTGLTANTTYDVYVQANCGSDQSTWIGISFTTECDAVADISENFDADASLPDCFGTIVDGTYASAAVTTTSQVSGTNSCQLQKFQDTETATLILPPVTTLGDNYRLKFSVNSFTSEGSSVMNVGTIDGDGNFTSFQEITITSNSAWESQTIDFSTYAGTATKVAITALYNETSNGNNQYSTTFIDDVVWEQNPSCTEPSGLTASSITTVSANLSWTAGADETNWNVEYGETGFTQGTGSTQAVSTSSYSLTGLTANTSYDVYVQADCGSNQSPWITISVIIPCGANSTLPYTEDFEASTTNMPDCFSETGLSSDGIWSFGSNADASSSYWSVSEHTNIAYTNDDACNCDKSQDRLILQEQDFSAINVSPVLSFDAHNNGSYGGSGLIEVSLDGGTTWATAYTISTSANWQDGLQYSLDYAGESSVTIALTYNDGGGWAGGLAVDNISISEAPTCPDLDKSTFSSSNITLSEADISWTAGADETVWNVEYGPSGFAQSDGTLVSSSNTNYTISGLSAGSLYDVYIQADCGGGETGSWAGPLTFSTIGDCGAYTVTLVDTYGDSWNGGLLEVSINSVVVYSLTIAEGSGPESTEIQTNSGDIIAFNYTAGGFPVENEYTVTNELGVVVAEEGLNNGTPGSVSFEACYCEEINEITVDECNTFTWSDGNGETYTESGSYSFENGTNADGCQIIESLELTIYNDVTETITETACVS
jgi:hypothetical protein